MNDTDRSDAMRRLGAEPCGGCGRTDVEPKTRSADELGLGVCAAFDATFSSAMICDRCWIEFLREEVARELAEREAGE